MKLKFRLPVLMIGLVLISNLVLGTLSFKESSSMVLDKDGKFFTRVVEDYHKITQSTVETEKQVVNGLSNRIDFIELARVAKNKDYLDLKTEDADLLFQTRNELEKIATSRENLEQIFLINQSGKVIIDSIGNAIEEDFSMQPYYFNVVHQKNIMLSENVVSTNTGSNVVHFAAPLVDPDTGEGIGMVINAVYTNSFFTEMRAEKLGETGYIYVLDKYGFVLSHPDKDLIGKVIDHEYILDLITNLRIDKDTDQREVLLDSYDNGAKTFACTLIPDLNWVVIAEEETQE
ncbi:MAG: cache domain-containing protein, partial [Peptococcaceae bacterium]